MESINYFDGFEPIHKMARNSVKRELTKKELEKVWRAFVKGANQCGLFYLPKKDSMPFTVCSGSVWNATEGSVIRFAKLVEKALERPITTKKEGDFLKWQYFNATIRERKGAASNTPVWGKALKDRILCHADKMGHKGAKKVGLFKNDENKHDYRRSFGFNFVQSFDYKTERGKAKAMLHNGVITLAEYKERIRAIRAMRQDILEAKDGFKIATRHAFNNKGHAHVGTNVKGAMPVYKPKSKTPVNDKTMPRHYIDGNLKPVGHEIQPKTPMPAIAKTERQKRWQKLLSLSGYPLDVVRDLIRQEAKGGAEVTIELIEKTVAEKKKAATESE